MANKIVVNTEALEDIAARLSRLANELTEEAENVLHASRMPDYCGHRTAPNRCRLQAVSFSCGGRTIEDSLNSYSRGMKSLARHAQKLAKRVKRVSDRFTEMEADISKLVDKGLPSELFAGVGVAAQFLQIIGPGGQLDPFRGAEKGIGWQPDPFRHAEKSIGWQPDPLRGPKTEWEDVVGSLNQAPFNPSVSVGESISGMQNLVSDAPILGPGGQLDVGQMQFFSSDLSDTVIGMDTPGIDAPILGPTTPGTGVDIGSLVIGMETPGIDAPILGPTTQDTGANASGTSVPFLSKSPW